MKSECDFYLDRAAKCLDMAEHVDRQYRGDLIQIARGWVQLAQEEVEWGEGSGDAAVVHRLAADGADNHVLAPVSAE